MGKGDLVGVVGFDGPEALAHHEFPVRFRPRSWRGLGALTYTTPGTGPRYLQGPLFELHPGFLQSIADDLLERGGARAMMRAMDDLKTEAQRRVPRETGDLAGTATAVVIDDGAEIYRR